VTTFELTNENIIIDSEDERLPSSHSSWTRNDGDERVLDLVLETTDEAVAFRLLGHIEVQCDLLEFGDVCESSAGLTKTVKLQKRGGLKMGVREFRAELGEELGEVLEERRITAFDTSEPFDGRAIRHV
jgi:hypothetical protein